MQHDNYYVNDDQTEARRQEQEQEHDRRQALINRQLQLQLLLWLQANRWPSLTKWRMQGNI